MHLLTTIESYVVGERKKVRADHILQVTVEPMLQHMIYMLRILQTLEIVSCGDAA